jgi:hypothetical protein
MHPTIPVFALALSSLLPSTAAAPMVVGRAEGRGIQGTGVDADEQKLVLVKRPTAIEYAVMGADAAHPDAAAVDATNADRARKVVRVKRATLIGYGLVNIDDANTNATMVEYNVRRAWGEARSGKGPSARA